MVGAVATRSEQAGSADPRLQKSAQEFEAMLLADLMKLGSEEGQPDGELDQSSGSYEDLRNQAVAAEMAKNGGIGIGRMLIDSLGKKASIKDFSSADDTSIAGRIRGEQKL